jgi:transcriptional regulator with XRE-family HTH domain
MLHESVRTLGEELHSIRELRKLSLREIEQATGISNAYLSQLENDKIKKPSPHFLHKLASIYDISFEMLMERIGYVAPKPKEGGPKTLAGAALFSEENLSADEEHALMDYLNHLRSRQRK